jgi:hypothetical protein
MCRGMPLFAEEHARHNPRLDDIYAAEVLPPQAV